jgi:toxin ParE1/3/4
MPKLIFTNKAVEDLSEIWNYSADNWSEQKADRYYSQIIESCQKLLQFPKIGKKYDDVIYGLSGIKSGKHIVFYIHTDDLDIKITRILHENMDIRNRLRDK